ncbi:MAG: hypothetical protein ABI411_03825 [Tahibacter sp.]
MKIFRPLFAPCMFLSRVAIGVLGIATPSAATEPDFAIMVGNLQSELGCTQDWNPSCTVTGLQFDANDGIWQGSWTVPTGNYLYGVALHLDWSEPYGLLGHLMTPGYEVPLNIASPRVVKFYYDHATHWIVDSLGTRIVTAAGDFQHALGCTGDWQPDCLRTLLEDVDADGVFERRVTGLDTGSYQFKIAIGEAWIENYGLGGIADGASVSFDVDNPADDIELRFVSATNVPTATVTTDWLFRNAFE